MKKYEIYQVTNINTNKSYIGYTSKGIEKRIHKHYTNAISGLDTHFYKSIRKHGMQNFKWKIIDVANNLNEAKQKEIKYIEFFDTKQNGYNMTEGGDGGDIINQLSPEKYKLFIEKQILNNTGPNNGRFSGYSDLDLIEFGVKFMIDTKFNWIQNKWYEEYNLKLKVPQNFSKFRFNGKGKQGFFEQIILMLNSLGYTDIKEIKYKPTDTHKTNLSNLYKGTKWYHNKKLKQNKQYLPEQVPKEWKIGRINFKNTHNVKNY